jgi:hypothetical protein
MLPYPYVEAVAENKATRLDQLFALLEQNHISYCIIGDQAVNAYVDPAISLDLDIVIALDQSEQAKTLLAREFPLTECAHSLNITPDGSRMRVHVQTDPRYANFVDRSTHRKILGQTLPVAALEDVLQDKIWAFLDPQRRASKRQKDLADIARLVQRYPRLRAALPEEVSQPLLSQFCITQRDHLITHDSVKQPTVANP